LRESGEHPTTLHDMNSSLMPSKVGVGETLSSGQISPKSGDSIQSLKRTSADPSPMLEDPEPFRPRPIKLGQ
jgi:hypothetical protein